MISSYEDLKSIIDKNVYSLLQEEDRYSKILSDSEKYSLEVGGKRIRPAIMMSVCEMLGGNAEKILPFALALEYIHTYSLIHDDLPVMDNDDYRRGKLSNHKVFGEDIALLAGDGLLTEASFTMARELAKDTDSYKAMAMKTILSKAYYMVKGQVADIKSTEKPDKDELYYIDLHKTAALFEAAAMSGAYLAKADSETVLDMNYFGRELGIAFQIADDIDDINKGEKLNYASIFGLEDAKEQLSAHINYAKDILSKYENNQVLMGYLMLIENSVNK